ncbi:MAG: hypothetical protein LBE75_04135 [Burkholderiales bacterium]|nr:hypothetical protein [Burkholderiales bacterium]
MSEHDHGGIFLYGGWCVTTGTILACRTGAPAPASAGQLATRPVCTGCWAEEYGVAMSLCGKRAPAKTILPVMAGSLY